MLSLPATPPSTFSWPLLSPLPCPAPPCFTQDEHLSIRQLSALTSLKVEDILSTLQSLGVIKYWKGQHVVSLSTQVIEAHLRDNTSQQYFAKPSCVRWAPRPLAPKASAKR